MLQWIIRSVGEVEEGVGLTLGGVKDGVVLKLGWAGFWKWAWGRLGGFMDQAGLDGEGVLGGLVLYWIWICLKLTKGTIC